MALPPFLPAHLLFWIGLAGGLWVLAFTLFLGVYGPILTRPALDGSGD